MGCSNWAGGEIRGGERKMLCGSLEWAVTHIRVAFDNAHGALVSLRILWAIQVQQQQSFIPQGP